MLSIGTACKAVFSLAVVASTMITGAQAPRALTESGPISGVTEAGLNIYKGIPFAAPPIGSLRWRPPASVASWTQTRRAVAFAPACMQEGVSMPGEATPQISEDCLYLNIWTPATSGQRALKVGPLPVIVWIYGGGYINGSSSMPLYWGDKLAHKGVVVVTIAYRLGPLGFLAHPELTRESTHHSSGNYGLMDQIAALHWIQRNIASFGGDPRNVTIAGQSAGAMCVSILMASPLAKGLFQRAIAESGGLFEPLQLAPKYLLANAESDGEKFGTSLHATSIEELRALPATLLMGNAGGITHPVIDGFVLPLSPYDAFASGKQNDVPLLLGSNTEEARSLTDVSKVTAAGFESDLEHSFGQLPPALVAAYPHSTDEEARKARLEFERDLRFGWDMWAWARLQASSGHSPVFYYSFNQKPPFPAGSLYEGWGSSHYAELWYVFDHLNQDPWAWTTADRNVAAEMSSYWVNFARSGDPAGSGLAPWPAFTTKQNDVLQIGDLTTVGGVANIKSLTVFDEVYSSVRGHPFGAE
jgi:para-nitrobenzyl esterase